MQDIFGILLIVIGASSGLLFQDPVVCRFTESNQCSVALRRRLHLPMPLEDGFNLNIIDKTNTTRFILKYRKSYSKPPTPDLPSWQFVNDSKTMILTSAARNDSGTYTLVIFDANGKEKGTYTLQLNIEAEVSSVNVWYSCSSPEVMKVYCSADGDNLRFNWTSALNTLPQLENGTSTLTLNKDHHGKVTCSVENHVSRNHNTTDLQPCPEPTTISTAEATNASSTTWSRGTSPTVSSNETNRINQTRSPSVSRSNNSSGILNLALIIMGSVCVLLVMICILAFYMYKKRQSQKNQEVISQEGKELVYAQVTHIPMDTTGTRPCTSLAQEEEVEYATVVNRAAKRKQKKKEEEVQYGELVFNTSAKSKHEMAKVQDDCVYSQVQHGR